MSEHAAGYRPEIDGLRAVAVLPVIAYHAGLPGLPGGFLGVDVFFVISGYLITRILAADLAASQFSIARFYERRARRILPALVATLAVSLPLAIWLLLPGQLISFGKSMISVNLFLSNVYFWQSTNYFAEAADLQPLLHTWSLAVEEQFYLFYPLALLLLWRFARRRFIAILALTAVASFALSVWASYNAPAANFYLLPSRGWELLAGALCAFGHRGSTKTKMLESVLATFGLVMVLASMVILDDGSALPGIGTLLPVIGTCLIILFARAGEGPAGLFLTQRGVVGIGLISYSAYLFHQPLFAFARIGWPETASPSMLALLGLFTLVLAALSFRYVEQPFRSTGTAPRVKRARVFGAGFSVSILLATIGTVLIANHGLVYRYDPGDHDLALFNRQTAGAYVRTRFNALLLRPFDDDGRLRLLVLGDSFGQDFVNILYEGGVAARFTIATHHVSKQCGNLLVGADLSEYVPPTYHALCTREGGLERRELQPLIKTADIIVLASDWQSWQLPYVAETVEGLSALGSAEVFVLGRKDFGTIRIHELLEQPFKVRLTLRNPISAYQIEADTTLRSAIGRRFIDIETAMCAGNKGCPLFTPDGALISYDGLHLTRPGAVWASAHLTPILPFGRTAPK